MTTHLLAVLGFKTISLGVKIVADTEDKISPEILHCTTTTLNIKSFPTKCFFSNTNANTSHTSSVAALEFVSFLSS